MNNKVNPDAKSWIPGMGPWPAGKGEGVDLVIVDCEGKPFVCRIGPLESTGEPVNGRKKGGDPKAAPKATTGGEEPAG